MCWQDAPEESFLPTSVGLCWDADCPQEASHMLRHVVPCCKAGDCKNPHSKPNHCGAVWAVRTKRPLTKLAELYGWKLLSHDHILQNCTNGDPVWLAMKAPRLIQPQLCHVYVTIFGKALAGYPSFLGTSESGISNSGFTLKRKPLPAFLTESNQIWDKLQEYCNFFWKKDIQMACSS